MRQATMMAMMRTRTAVMAGIFSFGGLFGLLGENSERVQKARDFCLHVAVWCINNEQKNYSITPPNFCLYFERPGTWTVCSVTYALIVH